MKPYIIYARRSTDDANNQKNSLEYQETECRAFAERNKIPLSKETLDPLLQDGVIKERHSAFKSNALSVNGAGLVEYQIERPKFMQMISWLLEGKYGGIIVLCYDRISRSERDDMVVKELIKKHNICIRFVHADYDISTSSGELHMDIDGMFSQHHSRVTSEKVKMTFKKLRGEGHCTYVSNIGYLDNGSENKVFDPERASLIKRAFELYDTGDYSEIELMKWINEQGLTSKPRRRRRTPEDILRGVEVAEKSSIPISKSTMHVILTSQFYVGKVHHKGDWIEGGHPPLIDEVLFWRVQQRLKENCVSIHYMEKLMFSYRRLVKCSCGRCYSPYLQKGHTYYIVKCKEGCTNLERNVKEDIIVEGIQEIMDRIRFSDDELAQIESGAKSGLRKVAAKRDAALEDLSRRKTRVNKDLDYMKQNKVTLLREGAMSPAEWKGEEQRLLAELREVDALHGAHTETEEEMLKYVLMVSELVKNASLLYKHATTQEKREIAHMLFLELTVVDGKVASYKAKEQFAPLLERHNAQVGSSGWIRTSNHSVNSRMLYH